MVHSAPDRYIRHWLRYFSNFVLTRWIKSTNLSCQFFCYYLSPNVTIRYFKIHRSPCSTLNHCKKMHQRTLRLSIKMTAANYKFKACKWAVKWQFSPLRKIFRASEYPLFFRWSKRHDPISGTMTEIVKHEQRSLNLHWSAVFVLVFVWIETSCHGPLD